MLAVLVILAALVPLVLFLGPGDPADAAKRSLLCSGVAVAGLLFLAIWLRPEQDDDGEGHAFFAQVWESFPPLRVHVALVGAFFVLFLVLPESSGQALDSLRTWRLDTFGGPLPRRSACPPRCSSRCACGRSSPTSRPTDGSFDGPRTPTAMFARVSASAGSSSAPWSRSPGRSGPGSAAKASPLSDS